MFKMCFSCREEDYCVLLQVLHLDIQSPFNSQLYACPGNCVAGILSSEGKKILSGPRPSSNIDLSQQSVPVLGCGGGDGVVAG